MVETLEKLWHYYGFGPGMSIVRIEGEMSAEGNTSQQHLTSLTLYVRFSEDLKLGKYGPYGSSGSGKYPFSFPGVILGLFGQSNDDLDAIGFDIDTAPSPTLPYYKKKLLLLELISVNRLTMHLLHCHP